MYIVAAFPGCGKSTLADQFPDVADSDSSEFPKDKFPDNYLTHIQRRNDKDQLTLVSTHKDVREGLVARNLPFFLIYPEMGLLEEYYHRYKARAGTGKHGNKNNEDWFADLMKEHWNEWVSECQAQRDCIHRVLKSGEFLGDVLAVENGKFVLKPNKK